jgi:hypothetical protein
MDLLIEQMDLRSKLLASRLWARGSAGERKLSYASPTCAGSSPSQIGLTLWRRSHPFLVCGELPPEQIHRHVRLRCLERGVLVRDYILELLARDGIR